MSIDSFGSRYPSDRTRGFPTGVRSFSRIRSIMDAAVVSRMFMSWDVTLTEAAAAAAAPLAAKRASSSSTMTKSKKMSHNFMTLYQPLMSRENMRRTHRLQYSWGGTAMSCAMYPWRVTSPATSRIFSRTDAVMTSMGLSTSLLYSSDCLVSVTSYAGNRLDMTHSNRPYASCTSLDGSNSLSMDGSSSPPAAAAAASTQNRSVSRAR
mmetsp:Transcript_12138/g.35494  ORF Transcript_12138/g.35494 Transcript_12138/m.35494 type:complete len:208 (-) Transcript_12138:1528-2151(-)